MRLGSEMLSLVMSKGFHGNEVQTIKFLGTDNRDLKYLICSISYKATEQSICTSLTALYTLLTT